MADTAVDTTATAEVTAKVRFISFFFLFGWTVVLKDFGRTFFEVILLFVLTIGLIR